MKKPKKKVLYTIEKDPVDTLITLGLGLTVFPWITMLSIGALGHRLGIPFLYKFGFFNVVLVILALYPVRGAGSTKKIVVGPTNE